MPNLLILHGPPASGKLTTAKQISTLTGAAVFHNHLTLDVAKSILEFGTPEFWQLVGELRILSLQTHFEHGKGTLLFTWCYEHPEDAEFLNRINAIATKHNGRILPVYLDCPAAGLEQRVANPERIKMKKLSTVAGLQECLSNKSYGPIPYENCITLNSAVNTAVFNAQRIAEQFNL